MGQCARAGDDTDGGAQGLRRGKFESIHLPKFHLEADSAPTLRFTRVPQPNRDSINVTESTRSIPWFRNRTAFRFNCAVPGSGGTVPESVLTKLPLFYPTPRVIPLVITTSKIDSTIVLE